MVTRLNKEHFGEIVRHGHACITLEAEECSEGFLEMEEANPVQLLTSAVYQSFRSLRPNPPEVPTIH